MFFRLRCHFCGQRSKYSKGTTNFQCTGCEAFNFFDTNGEVADTPQDVADPPQQHIPEPRDFLSRSRPTSGGAKDDVFCSNCRKNQQIYMERLLDYLPDEDHPKYKEFEAKLPEFKAQLEERYPQICSKCATKVQAKIHKADYEAKARQTATLMAETRARRGQSFIGRRDDAGKWTMRLLLRLVGMVLYASLLVQAAWHVYAIILAIYTTPLSPDEIQIPDFAVETTFEGCVTQARLLRFDTSCHQLLSRLVPKALITSLCLLWYNSGIKEWYHHTHRIEAVNGQTEHFRIQVFLLIIRVIGWYNLSNSTVAANLSKQQLFAAHGFMTIFMFLIQWISERTIKPEKWRLRGKIMPRPDEVDVFGPTAAPAVESYHRQASSVPPTLRLFARNEKPFPIENLAPKPKRGYSRLEMPSMPPPSPPDSMSDDEAMDIDSPGISTQQSNRPQLRSTYNYGKTQPLGWGEMRNELFGIQDNDRVEDARKRKEEEERAKLRYQPPVEQSPFRGRLPQAPMSMERRLRNPPTQVQFKKTPLSKQQDFMQQMRDSFENGKSFSKNKTEEASVQSPGGYDDDFDEDFSPVKVRTKGTIDRLESTPARSRTKGNLDLRQSGWTLDSDFSKPTGLEDLFTTGFNIADSPRRASIPTQQSSNLLPNVWILVVGLLIASLALGWNIPPVRRGVCLWLVQQIERLGY